MSAEYPGADEKVDISQLLELIDLLRDDLKKKAPVKDSVEWYLLNNLLDYGKALASYKTHEEIGDATRSLSRFCIDSLDWDSEVFRACTEITVRGRRLAK